MNRIYWAMCMSVFAVIGGGALAEDIDVRALQAEVAAQRAVINDLQAKLKYDDANANYAGAPEAILSLEKNACVTIGGLLNTRYYYRNAKIDSVLPNPDYERNIDPIGQPILGSYQRRARLKLGDFTISDAKLYVKIDVNEHFDAFLQMDLESSDNPKSDNAEKYYVRWKNICNSGFGVRVGRDALVFGEDQGMGVLASYTKSGDGAFKDTQWGSYIGGYYNTNNDWGYGLANLRRSTFGGRTGPGSFLPAHNYWDQGRIIQVTPYWEGLDGKLTAEVSFFQEEDNWSARRNNDSPSQILRHGATTYKSRNYGFGSVSARIGYMPIEGLKLSASVVNFHDKGAVSSWLGNGFRKNNTAVDAAVSYRPSFFSRLNLWGQYIHGWNVNHLEDLDSDALTFGGSIDLNECWSVFAQGDWLRTKDKYRNLDSKDTAWAVYGGVRYVLPYGVNFEAGWKHEQITWKNSGTKIAKGKGDTAYVHVGFDF